MAPILIPPRVNMVIGLNPGCTLEESHVVQSVCEVLEATAAVGLRFYYAEVGWSYIEESVFGPVLAAPIDIKKEIIVVNGDFASGLRVLNWGILSRRPSTHIRSPVFFKSEHLKNHPLILSEEFGRKAIFGALSPGGVFKIKFMLPSSVPQNIWDLLQKQPYLQVEGHTGSSSFSLRCVTVLSETLPVLIGASGAEKTAVHALCRKIGALSDRTFEMIQADSNNMEFDDEDFVLCPCSGPTDYITNLIAQGRYLVASPVVAIR